MIYLTTAFMTRVELQMKKAVAISCVQRWKHTATCVSKGEDLRWSGGPKNVVVSKVHMDVNSLIYDVLFA